MTYNNFSAVTGPPALSVVVVVAEVTAKLVAARMASICGWGLRLKRLRMKAAISR